MQASSVEQSAQKFVPSQTCPAFIVQSLTVWQLPDTHAPFRQMLFDPYPAMQAASSVHDPQWKVESQTCPGIVVQSLATWQFPGKQAPWMQM